MARIRTIKPEFPQSESTGRTSRDARLLFILLWTICDDDGRCRGSSRMLASLLFPYDEDAPGLIDGWLDDLEDGGLVRRYCVDGAVYLEVCNWLKHQKIDRPTPSKHPKFAEGSPKAREASLLEVDLGPGKEGTGIKPLAPSPAVSPPPNGHDLLAEKDDPEVVQIPLVGKEGVFVVRKSLRDELDTLYPAVEPDQTLREIRGWNLANPARRKTKRGIKTHIFDWFKREQDKQSRART